MAERLTEKDKYGNNAIFQNKDKFTIAKDKNNDIRVYGKAIDKLAQLEDVMEDYNIKTVEELGKRLEDVEQYNYETNRQFIDVMAKYGIESIEELDKKLSDGITWQKACELACREAPIHCPNPPEYYNAQDEYGSDEPYYIQESACEFSDDAERCLECQINYLYQQAKKENNND